MVLDHSKIVFTIYNLSLGTSVCTGVSVLSYVDLCKTEYKVKSTDSPERKGLDEMLWETSTPLIKIVEKKKTTKQST
jgi:hypothetical protein